jgi:hypothetical protein
MKETLELSLTTRGSLVHKLGLGDIKGIDNGSGDGTTDTGAENSTGDGIMLGEREREREKGNGKRRRDNEIKGENIKWGQRGQIDRQ